MEEYSAGQLVKNKGADDDAGHPVIAIDFTETNPIEGEFDFTDFAYDDLNIEWHLAVHPPVEVINDGSNTAADQANIDADIVAVNASFVTVFHDQTLLRQTINDNWLAGHPGGEILRDVTDLRPYLPEPPGGWDQTFAMSHIPLPWQYDGTLLHIVPDPITVDYPIYLTYGQPGTLALEPIQMGQVIGKYPRLTDQRRNRDSFLINLSWLKDNIIDITATRKTFHVNGTVELNYTFNGGSFTAAPKRAVTFSNAPQIPPVPPFLDKKTKQVSGRIEDVIIARFDRHGFVEVD